MPREKVGQSTSGLRRERRGKTIPKLLYIAALFALFPSASSSHASDYFLEGRLFTIREDLMPVKLKERTADVLTQRDVEKYLVEIKEFDRNINKMDEKEDKKWSEFRYKSFHLRLSRYDDRQTNRDALLPAAGNSPWEIMKSLPAQLGNAPYRHTMETMGRIFTPQLDFGIEF